MARIKPVGKNNRADADAGAETDSPQRSSRASADGVDAPATADQATADEPHPTDAGRSGAFGALASKAFARYWPALALSLTGV
ncbi:MAG: hypothetical protein M3121_05365, partial [Chloroflexota bacterium]|nr:hypothetical protein [Chloroflexota bacterium]